MRGANQGYNILDDIRAHPSYGYNEETGKIGYVNGDPPDKLTLRGRGNGSFRDRPGPLRQDFADKLAAADDEEFVRITEDRIWFSAWANNNSNSDYHWQADACYHEAQRRGKPELYVRAYERARASAGC